MIRKGRKRARRQSGIALFMVMGALALLTVLVAELGYSTQMHSRLAYNYVDGLRAYYLAKSAYKLSLVRLKAYLQIKSFLDEPNNKQIKESLPAGTIEKIWNVPILFPLPVPKEANMAETDAIKAFEKESKLPGSFTANISGESSKLNLNLLFVKEIQPEASGASGATGSTPLQQDGSSRQAQQPAGGPSGASAQPVNFRPLLEQTVTSLLEHKKNENREFSDVYRNVQGRDIIDAIEYYMFPEKPASNLPGFKPFKAKLGPLYSLTELHLIPGLDDELYKLLENSFTVYTTPGININMMSKRTLMALIPELNEVEAEDVLRKRDDPDQGRPWADEGAFYQDLAGTTAGGKTNEIKKRLADAGIKLITEELSFKISVLANVGLASRRLEAYVNLDPKAAKQSTQPGQPAQPATPQQPQTGQPQQPGQQDASAKKPTGVNLIYWRMI